MSRARRPALPGAGAALAALILFMACSPAAAEACPFPLGAYLLGHDVRAVDDAYGHRESWALDAGYDAPVLNEGRFVVDGARVGLVFENEYEFEPYGSTMETEVHIIGYKEFSPESGWNTTPAFISSDNVSEKVPLAASTSAAASLIGHDVWAAWSVSGHVTGEGNRSNPVPFWPENGTYIVARGNHNGAWGPIVELSALQPVAVSVRPSSAEFSGGAYFAYQTNANETLGQSFHIVGRAMDGASFGPIEEISVPYDGWTDETVAVASDGARVAAVWTQRNVTDFANGSTRVVLRVREPGGAWGAPVDVAPVGEREVAYPTVAFHAGRWFVAWSAVDPQVSALGDASILLRSFDPSSAALGAVLNITDATSPGFDSNAALASYGGVLHIAWTSNTQLSAPPTVADDVDNHMRTWNGSGLSPVAQMDERVGEDNDALWPGFFQAGGALFATYGLNLIDNASEPMNQRLIIRLLERPEREQEALNATYAIRPGPFLGNGTAQVFVSFQGPGGAAASDHYELELGDGAMIALPAGFARDNVSVPFHDNKFYGPVRAAWCGEPLPLNETAWPFPSPPAGQGPYGLVALAIIAAVGLALLASRLRRKRGASP